MIEFKTGNLLEANAEALVNTVNTAGVMGKGIALQFRQAFPQNFAVYQKACKRNEVQPGEMLVVETGQLTNPRYIINFPTKRHWKGKARLEDIEAGLKDLVRVIGEENIRSIAIPPLGCGFGELNWDEVRPRIVSAIQPLEGVKAMIFETKGAPQAETMRVTTKRPEMTIGRAALISLIDRYALPGYQLTLLEIQKLAYFLQEAGEPLRLSFVRHQYGPYAEKLNNVLQHIEGHYIRGYGDRSQSAAIHLIPGSTQEAEVFLSRYLETKERLARVAELIKGFESPYGMELLATTHWLAREDPTVKRDYSVAIQGFQAWNERKRARFRPEHIQIAWKRLHQQHWL